MGCSTHRAALQRLPFQRSGRDHTAQNGALRKSSPAFPGDIMGNWSEQCGSFLVTALSFCACWGTSIIVAEYESGYLCFKTLWPCNTETAVLAGACLPAHQPSAGCWDRARRGGILLPNTGRKRTHKNISKVTASSVQ